MIDQKNSSESRKVKIFISYSHRDEEHFNSLIESLAALRREGIVDDWHDRKIGAGDDWKNSIDEALSASQVILLLVSAAFINSDYCFTKEMSEALKMREEGRAKVIPIIVRSCEWQIHPLSSLQAVPKGANPVTSWDNRDEAWTDVVREVRKAVREFNHSPGLHSTGNDQVFNFNAPKINHFKFCDRDEQVIDFEEQLMNYDAKKPRLLVFLIQGHDAEMHDLMMDRLQEAFEKNDPNRAINPVTWWEPLRPKMELKHFWRNYKKQLVESNIDGYRVDERSTVENISHTVQEYLRKWERNHLLRLTYHIKEFEGQYPQTIHLRHLWESAAWMITDLPEDQMVIWLISIVEGSGADYSEHPDFEPQWIKDWKDYDPAQTTQNDSIPPVKLTVLPRLRCIKDYEAKRWCNRFPSDLRNEIRMEIDTFFSTRLGEEAPLSIFDRNLRPVVNNLLARNS